MTRRLLADVGPRLRELRLRAGLSQREVADIAGIHRAALSKVEHGYDHASVELLDRVAQVLGYVLVVELRPVGPGPA